MSMNIINLLSKKDLIKGKGASQEDINSAENTLSLKFSNEYKEYLSVFGFVSFDGKELTGICGISRLDVVNVTKNERSYNPDVPDDWYVIEELNIDGIVIWQSETGEVYQTSPNSKPTKIYNSLSEYIKSYE